MYEYMIMVHIEAIYNGLEAITQRGAILQTPFRLRYSGGYK